METWTPADNCTHCESDIDASHEGFDTLSTDVVVNDTPDTSRPPDTAHRLDSTPAGTVGSAYSCIMGLVSLNVKANSVLVHDPVLAGWDSVGHVTWHSGNAADQPPEVHVRDSAGANRGQPKHGHTTHTGT